MITSRLVGFAQGLLLLVVPPALAEPAYPVSARLTLAPRGEQHCLAVPGASGSDCSVVEQAQVAFSAAVARMFTAGTTANLELTLAVTDADLFENVMGGMQLSLRTRVRILAADGKVLDEITSGGSAPVFSQTPTHGAARVAAEEAARAFEVSYARSAAVGEWLVRNKVAPAAAVSIPGRSDKLIFFGAGVGLVQGGGDDDVAVSPSVRIGLSSGRFVLHAMYSRYTSSFQFASSHSLGITYPANLHVDDFGLEAGASFRLSPAVELRVGPGVHFLSGSVGFERGGGEQTVGSSSSTVSPSAFLSLSTTFLPFRSGVRFFAALEARAYFFSSLDIEDSGRSVSAANVSLGLILGAEVRWTPSQERAR